MKNYKAGPALFLFLLMGIISSWSYELDFIKDLQTRLNSFYNQNQIAKIHVIMNQPKYVAGDTAFFKVHLLSAQDLSPIEDKQIINVDLVDNAGKPILYNRLISENGVGWGQFIFSEDLKPGNYVLIAYSDEMKKTSSPDNFYQSSLTIAGPKEFLKDEPQYLEVFTEGGNLVAGQSNRLVVRTSKKDKAAIILNLSGKVVKEFTIGNSGFTDIIFSPVVGEKYFIETDGLKRDLPLVVEDGIVLHAEKDNEDESIFVKLQVPLGSRWRSGQLYLVMSMQSKIYFSTLISFKKDTLVSVSIPIKNRPSGIAQLTVFSTEKDVLCERLVFLDQTDPVSANINFDTTHYQTRKPVKVNITVKDSRNNLLQSNIAISVYKEDLFLSSQYPDFLSKILQSDLDYTGNIVWSRMSDKDKDHFLITQQWKRFQWNDLTEKNNELHTPVNVSPYYFRGKVISSERRSIPDSTLIAFYLNTRNFAYEVYSKKGGQFEFPLFTDFGDDEVFYIIRKKDDWFDNAYIQLTYDSVHPKISLNSSTGKSPDAYFVFSKLKNQVIKSYQYFLEKQKHESGVKEQDERNSILSPDFSVRMDKYTPFSSMVDILNEVVPLVRYSKINGKSVVRVFLNETATYSRKSPLYIIDGIMTDSTGFFLSLNPAYVSQISILQSPSKLLKFGSLGKNGIIIVETKIPEHAKSIPRSKRSFSVTGLSSPILFNAPDFDHADSKRIPDVRSALYWNPELRTGANGEIEAAFFTSDGTGNYIVHVEGITDDGRPFVKESRFAVSHN